MILPNTETRPIPRTGFRVRRSGEAVSPWDSIPVVLDPTSQMTSQTRVSTRPGSVSLQDIQNGYLVDSYIHQSVLKHTEKVFREGFYLSGDNTDAVDYVKLRLEMMTLSTGVHWMSPIIQAVRDYIKFGNGFLVKARFPRGTTVPRGLRRRAPEREVFVGGYFAVDPTKMAPILDEKTGMVRAWKYSGSGGAVEIDAGEVIHFAYDRQAGEILGTSYLVPVLDDVRALRQCEEMVIQLIYKSLNPLIHHEVPDTTGTGLGNQADVDAAASGHSTMAVNGYLCTPPGHRINIIGVESKALRAEGYLTILRNRVYAGLGLSDLMMGGSSTVSQGAAGEFASWVSDRISFMQKEIANVLTHSIIWELLAEGGYNPVFVPRDRVYWRFNEPDVVRRFKEEAQLALLYQGNIISEDEVRARMNLPPVTEDMRPGMYLNRVQIPLALARSQSEAVSDTGNSANASERLEWTISEQDFVTRVKSDLAALLSEGTCDEESALSVVDRCVNTTSALHGAPSRTLVDRVKSSVREVLHDGIPRRKAGFISKLYARIDSCSMEI